MRDLLDSRLGQLFILELESSSWSTRLEKLLREVQPAGVLVRLNIVRPAAFLRERVKGISSALRGTPLVGSADFHDSIPDIIRSTAAANSPRLLDAEFARRAEAAGKLHGDALRKLGRNVEFYLWLDVAARTAEGESDPDCDPHLIARCGAAYLRGLGQMQVAACVRDFPGDGSVEWDLEYGGLISSKPMAALWREDLVPFRKLLPKLPLVMVSRAAYKAYDFETPRPAIWSSEIVTGLLRVKLGYEGTVVAAVSDPLASNSDAEIGEATVKAMVAGCDLFVVPAKKSAVTSALRSLRSAFDSGRLSHERVEESLQRISAMKRKLTKPLRTISKKTLEELSRGIRTRRERAKKNEKSV